MKAPNPSLHLLLALSLPLTLAALQGCVIYDGDCKHCRDSFEDSGFWDDPDRDTGRDPVDDSDDKDSDDKDSDTSGDDTSGDDTSGDDTSGDDTSNPEPTWSFTLTPSEGEIGETFIGSIRAVGEGAPSPSEITSVTFIEDIEILATDTRDWEYLMALTIPTDGKAGNVDMVLVLEGGDAWLGQDVFTIYAAGSGHEAGSSDDGSVPSVD